MKPETLFVGLELDTGKEVEIPIFHTLTTGQTQLSGKTTVEKTLAEQLAEKGYKVLIFDTKENLEDYSGFGREISVCLRESTDPLVLLPLLESIFQRRLPTGYYSVLSEVSSGTQCFEEVIDKSKSMEKTSKSGWKKGACRTLYDLLERLQRQLDKVRTVPQLELPYSINRMVLNYFPRESQQLFIRNAFEDILKYHNKMTIVMLDEFSKFAPQRWGSACLPAIQDVITQTAITKTFCYLAAQFLATTNKDPLKACAVRLLGTQDHKTEAKHTIDLIPFRDVATEDDIMKLPVGHFIVTTKKWAKRIYFVPKGVPMKIARQVALRKDPSITSEWVRDKYLSGKKTLGIETVGLLPPPTKIRQLTYGEIKEKIKQELFAPLENLVLHLQETTKADLTEIRTDFFSKISGLSESFEELKTRLKPVKVDVAEIVGLVLQKLPAQQVDMEAIVEAVLKKIPAGAGSTVYKVEPLIMLKRKLLEDAKNQILTDITELDQEQKKMLKFIESLERGTKTTEVMTKCFFIQSSSSASRRRLNDKLAKMDTAGFVRRDQGGNIYPNLKDRITELIGLHEAKPEEIQAVYNHILAEMLE